MLSYLENLTIIRSKQKEEHSHVMDGDQEVIMAIYGHQGDDKAESVAHFVTHSAAVANVLEDLLEEIANKGLHPKLSVYGDAVHELRKLKEGLYFPVT